MNRSFEYLKKIFSLKRTKVTLYITAVLWLAFATQIFMNRYFHEDLKITQAFVNTNTEELESSIEIIAEHEKEFLSETDKKDIIRCLADTIGLTIDREITVIREGTRSEFSFTKQAKNATSILKVISVEKEEEAVIKMKHYIVIRLNIHESIQSIDNYKNKIENALKEMKVKNKQVTVQYEGSFNGTLTQEEKKRIAGALVDELQGERALEQEEGGIYTVYAYTGLINEYIVSADKKVNIQIAITYDDQTDKSRVYLATPILNQNW